MSDMKQASNRVSLLYPSVSLATTEAFTVGGPGGVRTGYGVSFCCLKAEREQGGGKNVSAVASADIPCQPEFFFF